MENNLRVKHEPRPCANCGTIFVPKNSNKRHCSDQCRHALRKKNLKADPVRWAGELEKRRENYKKDPARRRQYAVEWRKRNPDKNRLKSRLWKARNPEKVAAQETSYRARRKTRAARANDGTAHLIIPVLLELKHCQYCGHKFKSDAEKRIDHRHPLALGGLHSAANLEVCCDPCNGRKHAMPFDQWLATLKEPWATRARRRAEQANGAPLEQGQLFMRLQPRTDKPIDPKRAEREAAKQWQHWLRERAPDWWLDGYWANHPKPWIDPRLAEKDKRSMRYKLDADYREYHIRGKPSRQSAYRYPGGQRPSMGPTAAS
jgi:hypothetical protein